MRGESPGETKSGLRAGALGTLGAAALGMAMMAPALGIYANLGLIGGSAGEVAPAVFIVALLCTLPTALSYAFISREIPSAGSAYTWLSESINPFVGTLVGLLLLATYFIAVLLQPILFGLFFNDLLGAVFQTETGYLTWALGVVISTVIVAALAYPGMEISGKASIILTIIELLVVMALTATIFAAVIADGTVSAAPFDPGLSLHGPSGFSKALVFGLLSFVGFSVITTAAEETNSPRTIIPRVVVVSCLLLGGCWALSSWAFSLAVPAESWGEFVARGVNPVAAVAETHWGAGRLVIILTAISAVLGVYIASLIGYTRVAYAMARAGALPGFLAQLHPKYQTPWRSQHLAFAVALLIVLVWGRWLGLYLSYDWWGTSLVLFATISNIFVNVGCTAFFYRFRREQFSWIWHGLGPVIGIVASLLPLYYSFGPDLWRAGWKSGQSIILFSAVVIVLAILHAWNLQRQTEAAGTILAGEK
ncbi:MAG: APC family permease [Acidobacteria bacterium]|nr:APC family permease [Acidobacteriota bacterium]